VSYVFSGIIEIDIPIEHLHLLEDGHIKVKWEILQLNPNSQSRDEFAIDYSELEICTDALLSAENQ